MNTRPDVEAALARMHSAPEAERAKMKFRMMRANLAVFASEVLRGGVEHQGKFLLGPHHREWAQAVNKHHRILAIAARDHGKSFFYCFAYVLWQVSIRNPGQEGYIFSASRAQAVAHLTKIRREIVGHGATPGNPKLAHLLPFKRDNETEIEFANGSVVKARGFDTNVRGGHPLWVVADDMLSDDYIWSETIRTKGTDRFISAIEPMPVPGGQLIVVGTPFHAEDTYAHLERTGVYHVMKHPAVDPMTGAPLWPARYGKKALEEKKKLMGNALRWSREYLCQPISDDASVFPSWLFEQPGLKQPYPLGLDGKHWQARGFRCFAGVDLAISASANADYFVMFVIAVCPISGDLWLVDILRRQGLGYQEQVDTIVSVSKTYDCELVFIESNQYQRVITDMVIRTSNAPVKAFYTTGRQNRKQASTERRGMSGTYSANKNALDRGVPGLRMLFENRKIRIPWDESTRERVQVWITEMQSFSFVEGKLQGVGAHDDTVLSLWMAERAASFIGGVTMFDPEDDDAPKIAKPKNAEEAARLLADMPKPLTPFDDMEAPPPRSVPSWLVEDEVDEDEPDFFGIDDGTPRVPGFPGFQQR